MVMFSSVCDRKKNIPSLLFQYIQINFGENPENYSEALKKLEQLRQVSYWCDQWDCGKCSCTLAYCCGEDCIENLSHSQNVVNIPRDFEGCNTLRKYCGQLHFLQSRVPMAASQEAAVPVTW